MNNSISLRGKCLYALSCLTGLKQVVLSHVVKSREKRLWCGLSASCMCPCAQLHLAALIQFRSKCLWNDVIHWGAGSSTPKTCLQITHPIIPAEILPRGASRLCHVDKAKHDAMLCSVSVLQQFHSAAQTDLELIMNLSLTLNSQQFSSHSSPLPN